jgi:hypothetical protein
MKTWNYSGWKDGDRDMDDEIIVSYKNTIIGIGIIVLKLKIYEIQNVIIK